ncbi:IDEAL domain-containing protein [Viridibacillus sp. YIM B01967]|uniref:IDEAL domain-containing protein n=1 Tax=Viridibacillus soli TaxID=2798301 RepID=A0ABS1H867_9BACL|nr:IDEAL domain-containing protein [Viridibacillus soli]MBK3495609.1 IDEAL domain-containing protein [Viridibacillus soli]
MLHVRRMEPFYTKKEGIRLKMVFAYQYFSITKDEELYHFIPAEGKEIVLNLNSLQVENLSEVFVFQKGSRFIRLPLYQLLLISNIHDHLEQILEGLELKKESAPKEYYKSLNKDINDLISQLENANTLRLIDHALTVRDENLFYILTNKL